MPDTPDMQAEALDICEMVREKSIMPWSWFFPTTNQCVSCILITGGNPEMMACSCPTVNFYLNQLHPEQRFNLPQPAEKTK